MLTDRLTRVSEGIVSENVSDLVSELVQLAEVPQVQPKACYVAFTFGLKHRQTYFLRTLPDIHFFVLEV